MTKAKPQYPCNPILLPSGRYMCPNEPCYGRKIWDVAKNEHPDCITCAAAWHKIETAPSFRGHGVC